MRLHLAVIAMIAAFAMSLVGTGRAESSPSPPAPQDTSIRGEVLEVIDAGAFTYLRLKTKHDETWAAVAKAPVRKGAQVTIENGVAMNNFESKSLNKTFDRIVFGRLSGAAAGAPAGTGDPGWVHGRVPQPADVGSVNVAKASGADARTVAEIVTKRTELKDKPVAVRGKVVKFTGGVMGKNWVHLRDGSGSSADGTNDVVVTTRDEAQIGDVVVAKGVVRTDVNLGSGYSYAVLVDDAKLQK
jgi:hypothetical protein